VPHAPSSERMLIEVRPDVARACGSVPGSLINYRWQ
jgi:hypothetical protein